MLYQIYSIDDYSRHNAVYEGVSWGAVFTGSLLLLTLPVFLPLGGRWQRFRDWMGNTVQDPISKNCRSTSDEAADNIQVATSLPF
jgi:hypothetical protein